MKTIKGNSVVAFFALALVLMLAVPSLAFAAPNQDHRGLCFRDATQSSAVACRNYVDRTLAKVFNNQYPGYGSNYIDENNDGVCDNYEINHDYAYGYGSGHGQGHGAGKGYHHR